MMREMHDDKGGKKLGFKNSDILDVNWKRLQRF